MASKATIKDLYYVLQCKAILDRITLFKHSYGIRIKNSSFSSIRKTKWKGRQKSH